MLRSASLFVLVAAAAAFPLDAAPARSDPAPKPAKAPEPVFRPLERAVSTWRDEAAGHLVLTPDQIAALRGPGAAPRVARCVKLNNYWCIKKAGWNGELAADNEGHVAFASAVEGAAVAALLLKRYYVDFGRKNAMAIISHWAPAQCGDLVASAGSRTPRRTVKALAPRGLGNTLRARWLAGHSRGFVTSVAGRRTPQVRRSVVADHVSHMLPTPTIAVGLGEISKPMTLDALMMSSPNAPPSRSMIGMPRGGRTSRSGSLASAGSLSSCGDDGARISAYAAKAAIGVAVQPGGDLAIFDADGKPTKNLSIMMTNMARVEIGPLGPTSALIDAGIEAAFQPGRNPDKS